MLARTLLNKFLSTPSVRRATWQNRASITLSSISIHALREEGDAGCTAADGNAEVISIHALREEGDSRRPAARSCPRIFLSTPSARRATLTSRLSDLEQQISIHALREEGDAAQHEHEGHRGRFLSTPSARRATRFGAYHLYFWAYFYPRPPRGGRRQIWFIISVKMIISIHALREEGDAAAPTGCLCAKISIHALREEGDFALAVCVITHLLFLSTPSARRATTLTGQSWRSR